MPNAHYLENTGSEDLIYIGTLPKFPLPNRATRQALTSSGNTEILQAPTYNDISVAQWLGLTPKQVVKDHLGFSEETLDRLPHVKNWILPGSTDPLQVDFGDEQE